MRLIVYFCAAVAYLAIKTLGQDTVIPYLDAIPPTSFSCKDRIYGYYADTEANCQVFHICLNNRKWSFLCPNQTVFNQDVLVCDYPDSVDCSNAQDLYVINERLGQTNTPLKD